MKQLPDGCVDLVVTDPPYGITGAEWDRIPSKTYFDKILKVSKNQIIFGGNFFDLPRKAGWIIWYKKPFLKTCNEIEMLWTSFDIPNKVFEYRSAGNVEGIKNLKPNYNAPPKLYTSQKPVRVVQWLLQNYSHFNDLILDPFMGSGTTAVAAKQLNRRFIGFEINQKYVDIANERLKQEVLSL